MTHGKQSPEIVNNNDCCVEMMRVSAKWNEVGIYYIMFVLENKRFKFTVLMSTHADADIS